MVDLSWTDKVSLTVLIAAGLSLKGVVSAGLTVIIPAGSAFAGVGVVLAARFLYFLTVC